MTDSHDPMCPQHGQTMRSIIAFDTPCRCEFIARVRADEREDVGRRANAALRAKDERLVELLEDADHAEWVAARLVEVICRLDNAALYWQERAHNAWAQLDEGGVDLLAVRAERDAARAEVADLKETVALLRKGVAKRRARMNNLRAKVEGLRDGALEGFRSQPHSSHLGTMASTLERVLALIEEADHG